MVRLLQYTGIKNMDYIFTDENLIYPNEASLYSENIIYLSKIWNCHAGLNFKRKKINPPVLKKNFITFGCFNNYNKITDQVIDVWSKILNLVKNSKLVLKSSMNIHSTKRLTEKFKYNGVLDSIIFKETEKEFNNHLELYEQLILPWILFLIMGYNLFRSYIHGCSRTDYVWL